MRRRRRLAQHLAGAPEFADAEHEPIPLLELERRQRVRGSGGTVIHGKTIGKTMD